MTNSSPPTVGHNRPPDYFPEEALQFTQVQAQIIAFKTYPKIPALARDGYSVEDVQQILVLAVLEVKGYIDFFDNWKGYISKIMKHKSRDLVSGHHDEHARIQQEKGWTDYEAGFESDEHQEAVPVCIVKDTPETLLEEKQEREAMQFRAQVLKNEIKEYCAQFAMPYDEQQALECLIKVLKKASGMPKVEYKQFSVLTRERLEYLREQLMANGLHISLHKGKIRRRGIMQACREEFANGAHTTKDMCAALDRRGMNYNPSSVSPIVLDLRNQAGMPKDVRRKGVIAEITELFDAGKGIITVDEMRIALNDKGLKYVPSTVISQVNYLRRQYKDEVRNQEMGESDA